MPITIIRPRIVKGHSQTGETIKFNGRYFNLNFLDTYITSERETVVNLVTIDYIIQATLSLTLYNEGRENLSFNWAQPK
ncbi:SDR family oxidoreductase [Peribacillus simplex]|uniref:SDR family oxidoreductase n=1 Tax=Peribacillus simplex TaxID=1478 RepID=UPI0039998EBD